MSGTALGLAITGVGMYCPAGSNAQSACAAMRAGIAVFEELAFLDEEGEPIYGSFVRRIGATLPSQRSAALLQGALADIERWYPQPDSLEHCPTILVTHTNRLQTERELLEVLPNIPVDIIRGGATTSFLALQRAADLLATGAAHQVLICAVDCSTTGLQLRVLRDSGRLRNSSNPHGVVPGEAATCILVTRAHPGAGITIESLGVGLEPARLDNDIPLRATGLTTAIRDALTAAGIDMFAVDWRLANHGDESFFVKEQDLVLARLLESPKRNVPLWQSAEFIGDIGPAAGLTQLIWTTQAWARGYAPGCVALCMCSDSAGPRAAVLVRARTG